MKRRRAAAICILLLVLEALPWGVRLTVLQADGTRAEQFFACFSPEPVALGVVTPSVTVFLTCVTAALSLYYAQTAHRGVSVALLVLDGIALLAALGTLLAGPTVVSGIIGLLFIVHLLLIWQARKAF